MLPKINYIDRVSVDRMHSTGPRLLPEIVALLYSATPVVVIATLINGAILAAVLWPYMNPVAASIWLALILLNAAARVGLHVFFRRHFDNLDDGRRWDTYLLINVLAAGLIWGSLPYVLYPMASLAHLTFIAFVLGGMCVGALSVYAAQLRVLFAFLLPALLPLIVRLSTMDTEVRHAMALMVTLFLVMISVTGWRTHRSIIDFLTMRQAHRLAEKNLRLADSAFETHDGILITDAEGKILRANRAMHTISGYSHEELNGRKPLFFARDVHAGKTTELQSALALDGRWRGEIMDRRKNGETFPLDVSLSTITDENGYITHYVAHCRDLTSHKRNEERILFHAHYDSLTELPNRRLLLDRLQQEQARAQRHHHKGAVLFINLDRFKSVNGLLGHAMGDALLKQVANRLQHAIRAEDSVARVAGDEFVVVLSELADEVGPAAQQARIIAQKINIALSRPYQLSGQKLHCAASIGIVLFPCAEQNCDAEELLRQADIAMYRAKQSGTSMIEFYEPGMQTLTQNFLALENDLRGALERRELALHYQPLVNSSGAIIGAEALLRWHHPLRGLISPADFIPIAEETGLILPIGQWVLHSACAELAKWQKAKRGGQTLTMAVNVSPRQFRQENFVTSVLGAVSQNQIPPRSLTLELTENMLIDDIEETAKKMHILSSNGIQLAIDDFGTGYSSLRYLKNLPLNALKIDQSFIRDITTDSGSAALVMSVISMANHLGLKVVAEGVESLAELDLLRQHGCQLYQGYYFSRPVAAENFARLLSTHNADDNLEEALLSPG